ncbi:phage tail tape measure protein [Actinacidiphila rubida]|nr:phage tail tape measure protein [Actinacidiphila rubida]
MAAVNAQIDSTSAKMKVFNKTAMLAAAGFAVIGVEAVKAASKFDSEMTLLQTQAGVSADKIDGLKKGVLDLAGKVGQSPDSLAESLYHVESNFESMGISSSKALKLTETAAKGATVGHAGLVDVTNALTAAVAANIPGVENLDEAMGVLNATVGVGDMKMSDLAAAFGTGMVATVKGYGLSIKDVAAGLAVFGDNNIRGAKAGTQFRMTVQSLAAPAAGGAAALKSIGLATDTLAKDMQKGGLKLALEDLVAHMNAAGLSSKQQGQFITDAFGKKAGTGLNILVGQMDRLESKYPALDAGAKNFGQAWADTQKTFAFQMKQLETGAEALGITFGEKLIPPIQSTVHFLVEHKTASTDAALAMVALAAAAVGVATAMKAIAVSKAIWGGLTTGAAAARSVFESLALKTLYMQEAFVVAGGGARGLGAAFGTLSTGTKVAGAIAVVAGIALVAKHFSDESKQAKVSADDMSTALKNLAAGNGAAGTIAQLTKDAGNLHQSLMQRFNSNDSLWDILTNSGGKASAAKKDFKEAGQALADMVNAGQTSQAAAALQKMNDAGLHVPTKYLKDYNAALDGVKAESDLTAASQGRFGQQAEQVQQQLKAQQDVADGLAQSLQALDQINQASYDSETKFYDAIGKASEALKQNGKTLDVHTDKGRQNRDAVSAIAAATDDYTSKLSAQGASMQDIDAAYSKGYSSLVKAAEGFGYGATAAKKLADSLLHVPQEVKVQGNIDDLQAKLRTAKAQLKTVPASKQAKLIADIADLERKIRAAKAEISAVQGKTVAINIVTTHSTSGVMAHEGGGYATGGLAPMGQTAWVGEDGPELMQVTPLGTRILSNSDSKKLAKLNGLKVPGYARGTLTKAQQAALDRANAERAARSEALGSLGISYFGQLAGYRYNSFENATSGSSGSVGELESALNEWASKIKAASHGAQESRLIKDFDRFGAAALKNEAALLSVNSKLTAASDKLSALKDAAAQLKDSVSSGIVSGGSIAKTPAANALGVVEQLQGSVDNAKRFAADLARLKKSGLNSQSLSELAQAGVDGGLQTADALSGASPAYLKKINDLEKQLVAAGGSAGSTASNSVYGAGIAQAQGIVDGLKKQQAALDKVMMHAAQAMANELKKAFGRKAAGGTVGAAASGGARWGRTLVGEYGPEIADLPIGTRVHSAPDTARMLGGGQAAAPMHFTIQIGDREIGSFVVDPLRQEIRRQGGNVQAVLGQRGK